MKEQETSKFKIRLNEDQADTLFQDEISENRFEKLNQRVTIISIIIPILIAAIIFIVYLDIAKRMVKTQATGAKEVMNLSKDLDSKFSSLSIQNAKIEESLGKETAAFSKELAELKKGSTAIKADLKKNQTSIDKISKNKIDKKDFTNKIKIINEKLSPIATDLKNLHTEINTLDGKFSKTFQDLNNKAKSTEITIKTLKSDISILSSDKIDRKDLENALNKERQAFSQNLKQLNILAGNAETYNKRMNKLSQDLILNRERINLIQKKINAIKTNPNLTLKKTIIQPEKGKPSEKKTETGSTEIPSSEKKVEGETKEIYEQDIKE